MANFAIFVLGTVLWSYLTYKNEIHTALNYLRMKCAGRPKYIRKDVM